MPGISFAVSILRFHTDAVLGARRKRLGLVPNRHHQPVATLPLRTLSLLLPCRLQTLWRRKTFCSPRRYVIFSSLGVWLELRVVVAVSLSWQWFAHGSEGLAFVCHSPHVNFHGSCSVAPAQVETVVA